MNKLIQKVKWNLDGSNTEMYMYGEADFEANKTMQEPLEKLYQYENQTNMREKVVEYVGELETEIKRCENELLLLCNSVERYEEPKNPQEGQIWICESLTESKFEIRCRIATLQEVINDLKGRLEERV